MARFDERRLRNLTDSISYKRGRDLEQSGGVLRFWGSGTDTGGLERIELMGLVRGSHRSFYHTRIYLDRRTGEYENAHCDCMAFYKYDGLCKHCVALSLHYLSNEYEYLRQIFGKLPAWADGVNRRTDPALFDLLNRFGEKERLVVTGNRQSGRVRLEPMLIIDVSEVDVSLRIGTGQLYVVKDIPALVRRVCAVEEYSYGKNLTFVHCIEAFDEKSRPIMEFFIRQLEGRVPWYGSPMRNMRLNDGALDEFMEITGKDGLTVDTKMYAPKTYILTDAPLKQRLTLKGASGGVSLICEIPFKIETKNYNYYLKDGFIYRQDKRTRLEVGAIDNYLYEYGDDAFVGTEDLPLFVREVLPVLKKYYDITVKEVDLEQYMPEEAEFKAYFDLPQEDMITCDLVSEYSDGRKYHVFEGVPQKGNRNVPGELKAWSAVMEYCNAFDDARKLGVASGEDCMYTLLTEGMKAIQDVAELYVSERLKKITMVKRVKATVGISLSGDLLELKVDSEGMPPEQLASVLSKYDRRKKFMRLKDGTFLDMDDENLDTLAQVKKGLMLDEKDLAGGTVILPKFRAVYLDAQLADGKGMPVSKSRDFRALIRGMKDVSDSDYEVTESLSGVLREYQKDGYRWIETLCENGFGGILADDMGLGKTLQVIAFLLAHYQREDKEVLRTLVVCPASLVYNWEDECRRFAPALPVQAVAGTAAERTAMLERLPGRMVVITSYDLLKRDIANYQRIRFDYQIIDEAQFIKNSTTKAAKAVKKVSAGFRMALTGTPIENRLSELWSIFDYLMPGYLYTYQKFNRQIEAPIVKNDDREAMSRLQKMTGPFVLRRLKKDVLKDLPDKIERGMAARMTQGQRRLYDAHVQRLQLFLDKQDKDEFAKAKIQILSELTKLRQLCCDPSLIFEGYDEGSAKLDLCMELVEAAVDGGHKLLIFSQFTSMLDIIADSIAGKGIEYYMLTGATPKQERLSLVNSFNRDQVPVFLISLKAGGTGLNLTAADIVIHYDPWWNTAAQNQATDRTHRIGQKNVVTVYKLIAKDSIEENILRLQERKADLADQVLSGSLSDTASFTKEELMELLS